MRTTPTLLTILLLAAVPATASAQ
ncbi:MAG: hypothetical protein JWO90_2035, partial [Solirubrobacterales bacterium]|nr:hypothetical protein [Solirubrobacterales bacterium]